jgi:hypothetical protein
VWCNTGLAVVPPTGSVIQSLVVTDSYFDSGSANGIAIIPTGGSVQLMKVANTWCATNTANGVYLGGTGSILQMDFSNCTLANNTNNGLQIASTIATNVGFVGGSLSANGGSGFTVAAGVSNFRLIGCVVGASGQFAGNGYGVLIPAGASNNYVITGNTFTTNTTAQFSDLGTGTAKYTAGNTGTIGAGGAVKVNTVPTLDWSLDSTQCAISIATAGNAVLGAGSGLLLVSNPANGDQGLYLAGGGSVALVSTNAATWVAPTTTPAAGKTSVAWNGSAYAIYNAYGSTQVFTAALIKTRSTV